MINTLLIISLLSTIFTDLKYHKIFNFIAYPIMALGLIINFFTLGLDGIALSISGILVGYGACVIPYKAKICDLGDFKLLGIVGAFWGIDLTLPVIAFVYILIITIKLFGLIISKNLFRILIRGRRYLELILQYGISITTIIEEYDQKVVVPFSLFVSLAVVALILIRAVI